MLCCMDFVLCGMSCVGRTWFTMLLLSSRATVPVVVLEGRGLPCCYCHHEPLYRSSRCKDMVYHAVSVITSHCTSRHVGGTWFTMLVLSSRATVPVVMLERHGLPSRATVPVDMVEGRGLPCCYCHHEPLYQSSRCRDMVYHAVSVITSHCTSRHVGGTWFTITSHCTSHHVVCVEKTGGAWWEPT